MLCISVHAFKCLVWSVKTKCLRIGELMLLLSIIEEQKHTHEIEFLTARPTDGIEEKMIIIWRYLHLFTRNWKESEISVRLCYTSHMLFDVICGSMFICFTFMPLLWLIFIFLISFRTFFSGISLLFLVILLLLVWRACVFFCWHSFSYLDWYGNS